MISKFGTHNGQDVLRATLSDGDVSVNILNYGCVTQDWRVPLNGARVPVVLGFEAFEDYPAHSRSFAIIAGRVANRTKLGRFELDGVTYQLPTNNGPNHLHGGNLGLGRRLWTIEADGDRAVRLTYHSPDGEENYPCAVDFTVDIRLDGRAVTYEMSGVPDGRTPINLAQHSYYNLGGPDILGHRLQLTASRYTPVDDTLIPTGEVLPVADTHFDFTQGAVIGALAGAEAGIDLNFVLDDERDRTAPAVRLDHENGLSLRMWTDQPGIQVFNAPQMEIAVPGHDGQIYGNFSGLCLEAQKFPDALSNPQFPTVICSPDAPYHQKLVVEIG